MSKCFRASSLALIVLSPSFAWSDEETLVGSFTSRAGENAFRVVFPPSLGGMLVDMSITGGEVALAFDAEAGTSRIVSWRQDVEPISIYGMSTGPIAVTLDESVPSGGTYEPATGSFAVGAGFILAFDDSALSAVGLASPFLLTATEMGRIDGTGELSTISFSTEGTGHVGSGVFSYTCRASAEVRYDIPAGMGQPGDINLDHRFDISDPVCALGYLFLGRPAACQGAIDVNTDGQKDLSDAVAMLGYLFRGDAAPPMTPIPCDQQG
jgi:hypothetical protein